MNVIGLENRTGRGRLGSLADQLIDRSLPIPIFNGCWIWMLSIIKDGYGRMQIGPKKILAHRLSYEAFIGKIPEGMLVLHSCDVPSCINPDHLFIGTDQTNTDDKVSKGRHAHGPQHAAWSRGENQHAAKLSAEKVRLIRADDRPQSEIAKDFFVQQTVISAVKRGKTWKHVI